VTRHAGLASAEVATDGMTRLFASPMTHLDVEQVDRRWIRVGGRWLVDFATGAYLGLDSSLTDEDVATARRWGLRNGWSRATGTTPPTLSLERELAASLGMDRVRLSTSAALLNQSAFHALQAAFPAAAFDQDAHLSLQQGLRAAYPVGCRRPFRHDDPAHLDDVLRTLPAGPKLVGIDGVYSMRGTVARIEDLLAVCRRHDAVLYIDDVHGFGVRGPRGLGAIESVPDADRDRVLLLGSFAKSASNPVAFLAYPHRLWQAVEGIPALNYSGPPSTLHVAACRRHLASFPALAPRRARLRSASERLHRACHAHRVETLSTPGSAILAVAVHDQGVESAVAELFALGLVCKVAVHPVVRRGDEVLRFTLTATHTDAQLDLLEQALMHVSPYLRRT
jgi:8-amino-7-oxononanoate synthase